MKGIGLCLSGGGYRATLFHAGALRRLNELGVLNHQRFERVTSVSGGSITAAFLATAWNWPATSTVPVQQWERDFERRLLRLTARNIRTAAFLKGLLPWRSTVDGIAKAYDKALRTPTLLAELPPLFTICATDLAFGANWEFNAGRMGSYRTGSITIPRDWTIGKAVAASSCFPPVFQPMPIATSLGEWGGAYPEDAIVWARAMSDLRLSDGGVYDNMGIEPVWSADATDPGQYEFVLVSDAGGLFPALPDQGMPRRIKRYQGVQENQARGLRRRWLVERYKAKTGKGAYWTIGHARSDFLPDDLRGYTRDFARGTIARIRTDLDRFSEAETAVLMNHGYLVVDAAMHRYCPQLVAATAPELTPPFPEWLPGAKHSSRLVQELAESHKRKILGRR